MEKGNYKVVNTSEDSDYDFDDDEEEEEAEQEEQSVDDPADSDKEKDDKKPTNKLFTKESPVLTENAKNEEKLEPSKVIIKPSLSHLEDKRGLFANNADELRLSDNSVSNMQS